MARDTSKYEIDGIRFPSVTEVLGVMGISTFAYVDPAYLAQLAIDGTQVHDFSELIDDGLIDANEVHTGVPRIDDGVRAYQQFLASDVGSKFTWLETELAVCSAELGFGGTIDRVGLYDGQPAILDIKTAKAVSKSFKFQLAAYALLAAHHFSDKRWRVAQRFSLRVVSHNGEPRFHLTRHEDIEDLVAFEAFAFATRTLIKEGIVRPPWEEK